MIFTKILRASFPAQFQRRHGDEWESVVEDMLDHARQRGTLALIGAWAGLMWDTAGQAPLAHARQWWADLVGAPPVLVGMGTGMAALALGRHWLWRPIRACFVVSTRDGAAFLAGAITSLGLYTFLQHRAVLSMARQMKDPVLFDAMTGVGPFHIFIGVVALVLACFGVQHGKRWWQQWKQSGSPMVSPLLVFFLGLTLGLHLILLSVLPTIAVDSTQSFTSFSEHRKIPVEIPWSVDSSKWSDIQAQWFTVSDPGKPYESVVLREGYQQRWCDQRMANLGAQRLDIMARSYSSPHIAVLLWNGQMAVAAGQGCLTQSQLLREHQDMTQWSILHPGVVQRTWEPLSMFLAIDRLMAAHYLVEPNLHPRVEPYCQSLAAQQARQAKEAFDPNKTSPFCNALNIRWEQAYAKQHPWAESTWWQRVKWRMNLDLTGLAKHNAQVAPRMTQDDLKWVDQQLRANHSQWAASTAAVGAHDD